MSGKVPLSKRAAAKRAAELYEQFSGHDADEFEQVEIPDPPAVAAVIGRLEGVIYSTVRDGEEERYIHRFRAKSQPLLCVSPDGRQLLIVQGSYQFTDRGIVDD